MSIDKSLIISIGDELAKTLEHNIELLNLNLNASIQDAIYKLGIAFGEEEQFDIMTKPLKVIECNSQNKGERNDN